jgi:glycogen(starch) synthase
MRILIYSPAFLPLVGGLELQTQTLARGLAGLGEEVVVVTQTPGGSAGAEPYRIVRRPAPLELLRWVRWSQVVLHQNLSLRGLWPLLITRRPLVIAHHSWYRRVDGSEGFRDFVKRAVVRRVSGSISVSPAIAQALRAPSIVIENGFRDDLFREDPTTPRDRDLLFVGRLVSDKGVDILLRALATLAGLGLRPDLTVVGEGPERGDLEVLVRDLGLTREVTFAGLVDSEALAATYRRHRVVVVPSRYEEPFGLVALEAIACGCTVVGSSGGGLPQAIGPCGLTFPNGDAAALAVRLEEILSQPETNRRLRAGAEAHLARHSQASMVAGYREALRSAVEGRN